VTADLHFAPTDLSRDNLLREGVPDQNILVTGNPAIDALQQISKLPMPSQVKTWLDKWGICDGSKKLILVTAHRRENFGIPIKEICIALKSLAEFYGSTLQMVYPVHLNPNIKEPVYDLLNGVPGIELISPLDYLPMVHLLQAASVVLTDSGGIQEEATGLGKPTLVLREKTERPEGVEAGVLKLVGTDPKKIFIETQRLLEDPIAYAEMAHAANPYGDGHAAERIVKGIVEYKRIAL
jgi:UDP-N-acetylglucosamine 2-epimerase (non-hydrolysing)